MLVRFYLVAQRLARRHISKDRGCWCLSICRFLSIFYLLFLFSSLSVGMFELHFGAISPPFFPLLLFSFHVCAPRTRKAFQNLHSGLRQHCQQQFVSTHGPGSGSVGFGGLIQLSRCRLTCIVRTMPAHPRLESRKRRATLSPCPCRCLPRIMRHLHSRRLSPRQFKSRPVSM